MIAAPRDIPVPDLLRETARVLVENAEHLVRVAARLQEKAEGDES